MHADFYFVSVKNVMLFQELKRRAKTPVAYQRSHNNNLFDRNIQVVVERLRYLTDQLFLWDVSLHRSAAPQT